MGENANTNFETALGAITQDQFRAVLEDNVFDNVTALQEIREKSKVTIKNGGKQLQVPTMISENTNVDSFTYGDQVSIDSQKGFIDATYNKAYYGVTFPIFLQEMEENSGESQIVSIVGARIDQAMGSLNDRINRDLYLDGTGNSSKNILGLLAMIPSQEASTTYAGIDGTATDQTKWTHVYTAGAQGSVLSLLDETYYDLTDGNDKPDLMITNGLGMRIYNTALRSDATPSQVSSRMADGSYEMISHMGIPIKLDANSPNTSSLPTYHMLTTKYLGFYFKATQVKQVEPTDQFGLVYKNAVIAQLVTSRRNRQGKLLITS